MPEEKLYGTKITAQGAALIAGCILGGEKLKITEAAAGDGGGSYYLPTAEQTALIGELWRGPIASAALNPDVPHMLDVKIVIDDSVGNFVCREVGLFSEDDTLIAIANLPDTEKVAISTGVDGRLTILMHIVVADSSVLEFTLSPSLDTVGREELMSLLAAHNTDPLAHPDIREGIAAAIAAHNLAEQAHPGLQGQLGGLDSRLTLLELQYGTSVTGNSFMVTFASLEGLVVTGVWNEAYGRVEF